VEGTGYLESSCNYGPMKVNISSSCYRTHQGRFFFGSPCCSTTKDSPERLKNATECGRKGGTAPYEKVVGEKVVGGIPAAENEIPWQVGVMWQNETWLGCGAILLSCDPVIVVSAAHCFHRFNLGFDILPEQIKLAFGAHNMGTESPPLDKNEIRLDVEDIIVHPSFSTITIHAGINVRSNLNINFGENDIAVIKVKNGTTLNCKKRIIWPACLPNKIEYAGWNRTIVSGWGRVEDGGNVSTVLRKARVPIVTDEECTKNLLNVANFTENIDQLNVTEDIAQNIEDIAQNFAQIAKTKLCAGDIESGVDACQGDSGGPLVAQDKDSLGWSAVGIVSYGSALTGCGGETYGVYTEVGQYLDWIGSNFDLLPPEE